MQLAIGYGGCALLVDIVERRRIRPSNEPRAEAITYAHYSSIEEYIY
jgi:hypothetical protein